MSAQADIASVITPIIESNGKYLEEVKVANLGKKKLITVIVDSDSHLNLDQVTEVTRLISEAIENIPSLGSAPFTLEVTSPGIDRPLTLNRHWKKNIGKLVNVVLQDGNSIESRILSVTSDSIILESGEIKLSDIKKANLVIEFKKWV